MSKYFVCYSIYKSIKYKRTSYPEKIKFTHDTTHTQLFTKIIKTEIILKSNWNAKLESGLGREAY